MIEFKDVHVSYEASAPILKGVNFAIRDGEFVAFVGTNGAGKSTTMQMCIRDSSRAARRRCACPPAASWPRPRWRSKAA